MATLAVPREPVGLNFDPTTAFPSLKLAFVDEIARSIWLLVSAQHLTGEHLADWSLYLARMIRKHKPTSARDLFRLIERTNSVLPGYAGEGYVRGPYENVELFVERLFEAVVGGRLVKYCVVDR